MKGNTSFPPSYRRIFAFVKRGHIVYLVTFLCRSPLPPRRKLHVCGPLHITMTTTRCEWVRQIEIEGPFANVDCTHSLLILPPSPSPKASKFYAIPACSHRRGEEHARVSRSRGDGIWSVSSTKNRRTGCLFAPQTND